MHQIKKHLPNIKFNIASFIYLICSIIYIFNFNTLTQNRIIPIISILLSITFLFCAYQNKKTTVNKLVGNEIIKWISTVCIFSVCLWYSKHKLNFDYDIETEYLNYSAYGYAFAIAIPLCLFIYGLCVFSHVYLGKFTVYQSFYATILALPLCYLLKDFIHNQHGVNLIFRVGLILVIPYGFINLLTSMKNVYKNTLPFKEKKLTIKRIKLILKIWIKKSITRLNSYLKITDLLSIATALLYIGIFSIGIIPEYQRTFLLLDAFYKTDCNDKRDSFLYLRKSDNECYRITSNRVEITKMESFHSSH